MAQDWFANGTAPASSSPAPQRRGILLRDPYRPREEARKDEDQSFERERLANEAARLGISVQQLRMQQQDQARQNEEERRKDKTLNARGGVETTEAERTAAFLANRLAGGVQDLDRIGAAPAPGLAEATAGGTKIGNYAISQKRQRIIAAQGDILDAALTLGTGAAYTKEQLEGYRQSYFAQPGDGPETIADKQIRLRRLLDSAKIKAGAAAGQIIDTAVAGSPSFSALQGRAAPSPGAPAPADAPLNVGQQKLYDAFMAANPSATADQLRTFAANAGLGEVANADAIVAARNAGEGVSPASSAQYGQSTLAQGMSGVNEGVSNTLGAPVDLAAAAINLVPQGINALANTDIPTIKDPFMGSDWWKRQMSDVGSILPANEDGSGQFVRRVGQSVGGAAVPIAGTAGTLARAGAGALSATGGGVAAALAKQMFPDSPTAEMAAELVGSGLTGAGAVGLAKRGARSAVEAAVPSIGALKQQAGDLYRQAESRGVVAGPNVTTNLAGKIRQIAADEKLVWPDGQVNPAYPRADSSMKMLDAHAGTQVDVKQMQKLRENLTDAVGGTKGNERRIARLMLGGFDEEMAPLAPELGQARNVASRYLQAEDIQHAVDLAEPRAAQYSQSGMSNALRTEFRRLDRDIVNDKANFNPAAAAAVQDVARGTRGTNALVKLGKLAPTGVVSGALSSGVPFMVGNAFGGPALGAAASATTMSTGAIAKMLADRSVARSAGIADHLARNGGPLSVPGVVDEEMRRQIAAQLAASVASYEP